MRTGLHRERIEYFLKELVPVAEAAGVRLAAHPNDPPVQEMRGIASILYKPENYQRLLDIVPSASNTCEFCQGTVSEMVEGDEGIYDTIRQYGGQDKISYVHFRNGEPPRESDTRETENCRAVYSEQQ